MLSKRIITVIAAPYDQEAVTEYRGELWRESFERGAFDGPDEEPLLRHLYETTLNKVRIGNPREAT